MKFIGTKRRKWGLIESAAGLVGAAIAGRALEAGYKRARGKDLPRAGVAGVKWRQAIAWSAVAGVAVAVGQLVADGIASAAWKKATGRKPPRRRKWK